MKRNVASSLSEQEIQALAARLLDARTQCRPVSALTDERPGLSVSDGFLVQRRQIAARVGAHERIAGWKVGALSPASRALGMTEPFFGPLFDSEIHENSEDIEASALIKPGAEPEIGFVIEKRLAGPETSLVDSTDAIGGAMAALEIVDCRYKDWKFRAADIPADCGLTAGAIVSKKFVALDQIELETESMKWYQGDSLLATVRGDIVGGSPLNMIPWLTAKLFEWDMALEPGNIVLAGALTSHVKPALRETLRATFATLGSVAIRFV